MKNKRRSFFKGLSFNIIFPITVLLLVFATVVGVIGYVKFTDSLTEEYNDSAFRTAETATMLINAESVPEYLKEENITPINIFVNQGTDAFYDYISEQGYSEDRKIEITLLASEYALSLERLNVLCKKQNVTLVYLIAVDTSDYENFVSVFNCVNDEKYTPWNLGEKKYTTKTNENTYQRIYKDIYENGLLRDKVIREYNLNGKDPHITSLIPLYNSEKQVTSILCVQRPMSELNQGRTRYVVLVAITTFALAAFVIVIFGIYLRLQLVNPIRKVVDEAERFAKENKEGETQIDGKISNIEEIKTLASSISSMEKDTLKYIENLSQAISEKQRIGTELKIASIIQESSVPSTFPPYPDRKEFDLYASMKPAKEVGGDFYDFFLVDDNHLAFVMADVSGKGVAAALFMMVTKILINEVTLSGGTPAEILTKINEKICKSNKAEMFVTIWLGIMEISSGKIVYANAGHDDPAVYDGKEFRLLKSKHGFVIGGMSGVKYTDCEMVLKPNDKLFLYTDGLPEATNSDMQMFKIEGMLQALNSCGDLSPDRIINGVWDKVNGFVLDAPQFDDLTMLCIQYNGEKSFNNMKIKADRNNLNNVLDFIEEQAEKSGLSFKAINQMKIAAEEIFVNICNYAYDKDGGEIEISIYDQDSCFYICFSDSGKEYDPLSKEDPDITLSAEERNIGGLGIYMAKKLSDGISYERKDGKNILILEKKIWKN